MMIKKEIENFLLAKQGYLKKSPLEVAKGIWKSSTKHSMPKNKSEIQKELDQIRDVQTTLRMAKGAENSEEEENLIATYKKILELKNKPRKRLFFDLEVSPNMVLSWRIGRDISLSTEDIIQERAIICVCYKWEGESKVHSIEWNKGCDKDLLQKFSKIIDSADEVVGQNSDKFDIKWLRTRCIYHRIPVSPKFNSIDTLKMARAGFNFNSNKLDYMGDFLGLGKKIKTEYNLWKSILLDNDKKAMNQMTTYCKRDVQLLEDVYHRLQPYCPVKKFKYKI